MKPAITKPFTNIVTKGDAEILDLFGPSVQFLIMPESSDEAPCVLKGVIPPGVCSPMHSHSGIEAFFVLSGHVEVLSDEGGEAHWITARPGDMIEIPSNAKHGFRNRSEYPVVQLIITTSKLGRFFQEVGRPVTASEAVSPPAPEEVQHFLKTARRYGYWVATPEENAGVGISLF
jgi:quercetin dioxygenase-like cupin family protein